MAHGTIYTVTDPFIAFDITEGGIRIPYDDFLNHCSNMDVISAHLVSDGPPVSVEYALEKLGEFGHHGAQETIEGAVWKVERKGSFDFMAKYVRSDKIDGKYIPEFTNKDPIWLWG
jgi:hypothetical protein